MHYKCQSMHEQPLKGPIKIIMSNRAECNYIKEDDNFTLFNYMVNDYFSKEKAEEITLKQNVENKKRRDNLAKFIKKGLKYIKKIGTKNISKSTDKYNFLLDKINRSSFDYGQLLINLDKEDKKGVIDYLVETMYNKYLKETVFFLPQLCIMFTYKAYSEPLVSYLSDRAINNIKIALQLTWMLNSYTEDNYDAEILSKFNDVLNDLEESLVNGHRNNLANYYKYDEQKLILAHENKAKKDNGIIVEENASENNAEFAKYLKKQMQLNYFNVNVEFYNALKTMCEDLKNFPKESRKEQLKTYLNIYNADIDQKRTEYEEYLNDFPFFYGMLLPFNGALYDKNDYSDSYIILNMLPEESFCFSTKARVPTKICCECVKIDEVKSTKNIKEFFLSDDENKNFCIEKGNRKLTISSSNDNDGLRSSRVSRMSRVNIEKDLDRIIKSKQLKEEKDKNLCKFYDDINNNVPLNDYNNENGSENSIKDFEIIPDRNYKEVFGVNLEEKETELKKASKYKIFKTYKIVNFIAKADDDLRQELLTMQLINIFDTIFKSKNIPLKLRPYEILITSSSSGLLEFLNNTSSIDGIKKYMLDSNNTNLNYFFRNCFKSNIKSAQTNFVQSLAAYSLVCYYLQIKDRHNGNILMDRTGSIIHIDYGFILGISPGNINFESAPFKLTNEYVEIMDGEDSELYKMYKDLMVRGMMEAACYTENIVKIIEIMGKVSKMPCFENKKIDDILYKLRERFHANKTKEQYEKIIDDLVSSAKDNFWTGKYDLYQKFTNGIVP